MSTIMEIIKSSNVTFALIIFVFCVFYCEYGIYFVTIGSNCQWSNEDTSEDNIANASCTKAMVLADTHLLGNKRGHPLDRLRREWQMHRSYETTISLLSPNLIIILGDILDEGLIASPSEFDQYVKRFSEVFPSYHGIPIFVVVGNHDIGFHDRVVAFEPTLRKRFEVAFNTSLVEERIYHGNTFVSVNSMTFEGDSTYCSLCSQSMKEVELLGEKFRKRNPPTRPIVLLHFPLYRKTEDVCHEPDSATGEERSHNLRDGIDCLTKEATDFLVSQLNPLLVLDGHTHNGCRRKYPTFEEWTVSSFSWRNRKDPAFLLMTLCSEQPAIISKCFLPNEWVVYSIYGTSFVLILSLVLTSFWKKQRIMENC